MRVGHCRSREVAHLADGTDQTDCGAMPRVEWASTSIRSLSSDPVRRFAASRAATSVDPIPAMMPAHCGPFRLPRETAHLYAVVSFPSPHEHGLLRGSLDIRHEFSLSSCRTQANHAASDGSIWPKAGCASIACDAM